MSYELYKIPNWDAMNPMVCYSTFLFDFADKDKRAYVLLYFLKDGTSKSNTKENIFGAALLELPTMQLVRARLDELEDVPIYNFMFKGKEIIALRGARERYPVVDVFSFDPTTNRTLTVIGVTIRRNMTVHVQKWRPNGSSYFEEHKEDQAWYYVSDIRGRVGLLNKAQLVELATRYTFTDAKLNHDTLQPLNTTNLLDLVFPVIEIPDKERTDMGIEQYDTFMSLCNKTSVEELYLRNKKLSDNEVLLTANQIKRIRAFADLLLDEEMQSMVKKTDLNFIQGLYSEAIFKGYCTKDQLNKFEALYDNSYIGVDKAVTIYSLNRYLSGDYIPTLKASIQVLPDIDAAYNVRLLTHMPADVRSPYLNALRAEGQVSGDITSLASQLGGSFEGFDNRIKTPASYFEKVQERAILEGSSTKDALKNIRDILRYTLIFRCDDACDEYTDKCRLFIRHYRRAEGYSHLGARNFWQQLDSSYKGINTAYGNKSLGIKFEVQLHTPDSYKVKSGEMHKLYEEFRHPNTPQARRDMLSIEMLELSKNIRYPANVTELEVNSPDV